MVREVVRVLKSILSEQREQVAEWVDVLPAAQWALNTSYRLVRSCSWARCDSEVDVHMDWSVACGRSLISC